LDVPGHNVAMTQEAWPMAADPARRLGRAVEFHAQIGSTNDRAREALSRPDGEGLAVVADLQTAGRGRRGRTWVSPAGVNLMVSVGLHTQLDPPAAALLGIASALAVRDACAAEVPGHDLQVKWPNDVVDADGLKIAGLLVETALEDGRLAEAVIGTGINVNWPRAEMPDEVRARATSLRELAGRPVDRVTLLGRLLDALDAEVAALGTGRSPVERLREVSSIDGLRVTVDLGTEQVDGTAAGISDEGFLLLDTHAGRLALAIGEVVAVRTEPVAVGVRS
jgi:BirA family transcriptional regulator, biotin operon repressor / biotin---[acetyl-CoA-carboxylase] ligase